MAVQISGPGALQVQSITEVVDEGPDVNVYFDLKLFSHLCGSHGSLSACRDMRVRV